MGPHVHTASPASLVLVAMLIVMKDKVMDAMHWLPCSIYPAQHLTCSTSSHNLPKRAILIIPILHMRYQNTQRSSPVARVTRSQSVRAGDSKATQSHRETSAHKGGHVTSLQLCLLLGTVVCLHCEHPFVLIHISSREGVPNALNNKPRGYQDPPMPHQEKVPFKDNRSCPINEQS